MTRCACGQPSPDAAICTQCEHQLTLALMAAAAMAGDLQDAVARLLRRGTGGHGGGEAPLLIDLGAMAVRDHLRNCLAGWVRDTAADDWPADDLAAMAFWLIRRMPMVRLLPQAGEMVRDVTMAVSRAQAAIDRRPDMLPAGPCDVCRAMVYAEAGTDVAACLCGTVMTGVTARREAMVRQADILGSPAEIAATLAAIGRRVSDGTIRKWASRGRLQQHGDGWYRLSEVLALVSERDARMV